MSYVDAPALAVHDRLTPVVLVAVAAKFVGADGAETPGMTRSVMLCAGSESDSEELATATSARCAMAFVEVSCQRCADAPAVKFARFTVVVVEPLSTFATSISVSALSEERMAANAATSSGFGTPAATLTSPNFECAPS